MRGIIDMIDAHKFAERHAIGLRNAKQIVTGLNSIYGGQARYGGDRRSWRGHFGRARGRCRRDHLSLIDAAGRLAGSDNDEA